jgi:hypothetical protein
MPRPWKISFSDAIARSEARDQPADSSTVRSTVFGCRCVAPPDDCRDAVATIGDALGCRFFHRWTRLRELRPQHGQPVLTHLLDDLYRVVPIRMEHLVPGIDRSL